MNTDTTKTPRGSFTTSPLTPPPTDEKIKNSVPFIVKEIRSRKIGAGSSKAWLEYHLDEKEYKELLRLLESDEFLREFLRNKLRYDFFPATKLFVLRMPTRIHEVFLAKFVGDLERQLASIAGSESSSAIYARNIESHGSSTIDFGDTEYGVHHPDNQFQYLNSPYPSVVIEVSYSQRRKELRSLADDYILGSDGKIRAVVGVDIEYGMGKTATISVWRPRVKSNDLGAKELDAVQVVQMFRDDKNNPNTSTGAGLNLRLQDFVPDTSDKSLIYSDDRISISANTLCGYLEYAEEKTRCINSERATSHSAKFAMEKKRRASTPVEELEEEDMKKFREMEKKAEEKAEKDDSSYKTGSNSEAESVR